MVFDRQRHAALLLHNETLYELKEATWQPHVLPSTMTNCTVSRAMAYDGARQRTVLVGCTVPAQTWEWDGTNWFGPYGNPYIAMARRDFSLYSPALGLQSYNGTLQAPYAHQNALAELPSMGGVGLVDWDGTLRIWNGVAWSSGPKIAAGSMTEAGREIETANGSAGPTGLLTDYSFQLPVNPPLVEDATFHRILAFRGEPNETQEIDLTVPTEARAWSRDTLGRSSLVEPVFAEPATSTLQIGQWYTNPWPLEVWSFEQFQETTYSDPASAVLDNGQPYTQGVTLGVITPFWPFKLLTDTEKRRTLLLSHRGTLWQLGGESASGVGDSCTTVADCGAGVACVHGKCSAGNFGDACDNDRQCANFGSIGGCIDGVCCDNVLCSVACNTCVGSHPGICEPLPAGTPDPKHRKGQSDDPCDGVGCNPVCPGNSLTFTNQQISLGDFRPFCIFPPGPRPCGSGPTCVGGQFTPQTFCVGDACPQPMAATTCAGNLPCADASSCRTTCTTRTDCANPTWSCDASGTCAPDPAAQIAAQLGIPQLAWQSPRRRTSQEIRDIFRDAGVPEDDAGVFLLPIPPSNGLSVGYDPDLKTPSMGLRACLQHINACVAADNPLDQCVEAMPRCVSTTPWLGDSAGEDCCAEQCLVNYLEKRRTSTERQAFGQFFSSGCYPGLDQPGTDGGAP
jgi:hypothetical protein